MSAVATESEILLHLQDVARTFQMGEVAVHALKNISIDIYRGEFLVMVGPSGSGKTTLLNIIGGMDQPTAGIAEYAGKDLTQLGARAMTRYRRERIGFVFQFYNLVPNLTALENVMVASQISRNPLDEVEVLEMVGLKDRMHHFPSQLSGGEQQRVAIARALAKNPDLLLCDEPTGALDFETGKRILALLVRLKHDLGKTIVVITHNSAIGEVADRVMRLRSGEIVEIHQNPHPVPPEEIVW